MSETVDTPKFAYQSRRSFLKAGGFLGVAGAVAATLGACSNADPFRNPTSGAGSDSISVGSPVYYSAEIIAEIYAQRLEEAGFSVQRQFRIGQREIFMPELQAGSIQLFPDYAGNLLQYFDPDNSASTIEEIMAALPKALPKDIHAFAVAAASDQDSYNVTKEVARKYNLRTIGDLKKLGRPVRFGANSEAQDRPYGPAGLKAVYGVDSTFVPIEDSGGPLTVKALKDGDLDVADIYSADPSIKRNDLVTLEDPESLILPQNIVAVGHRSITLGAVAVVEDVNRRLSQDELVGLNARSVDEQLSADRIAKDWIAKQSF